MITLSQTRRPAHLHEERFNCELLSIARLAAGLTQKELSERLLIAQNTLSRWENGIRVPSDEEVDLIGEELDRPVGFFYRSERPLGVDAAMMFHRKRSRTRQSDLNKFHARVNVVRLAITAMMKHLDSWDVKIVKSPVEDAKSAADLAIKLRQAWSINRGPIRDLIGLVESAGAVVVEFDFGTDDIDALGLWPWDTMPLMFINSRAPADRLRFNVAHELAHLIMHDFPTETMEKEANEFAAEFLFPRSAVLTEATNLTTPSIWRLKQRWRVSGQCIISQAKAAKLIDSQRQKSLMCYFSKKGWRRREPVEIEREKGRMLSRMLSAFDELEFSQEEVRQMIGATSSELGSLFGIQDSQPTLRVFSDEVRRRPR